MSGHETYRAVIVGCGGIGAGYDAPGDARVLTHAHALRRAAGWTCAGVHDLDPARAQAAAERWGVRACPDLEALLGQRPDLVVVAVPDEAHAHCLRQVLEHRPRAVLCEKPLTSSYAESVAIVDTYGTNGVTLAVNYQRRYDPTVIDLKRRVESGATGRPLAASVAYSKGLAHNGSHAIDLLRYLFGEPAAGTATLHTVDWRDADPTVSGTLEFHGFEVHLIGVDERCYSIFEIDLVFERERVRFVHSGLEVERQLVEPDPVFPGFRELAPARRVPTGLGLAMLAQAEAIGRHLDDGAPLVNEARTVIAGQRVCEQMRTAPLGARFDLSGQAG